MIESEIEQIKNLNDIQLVQYFLDGVVSRATGDGFDNQLYSHVRTKLLENKAIENLLPSWLKSKRTADHFWQFIKGRYSSYAERKEFLWNEFTAVLNYLETKTISPIEVNIVFDAGHIHALWQKALDRKNMEPEGAITMARTLIESVLKHILDEQNIKYNDFTDLPELYREVSKSLNLAPEQHQEQVFKQILGGASGIISGLGSLRNKLGDAHGKSKNNVKPLERHSELAVNLAGAMTMFLYRTFKETRT